MDNDCDGLVDGDDPDVPDADGDGADACDDCDDGDPANHPANAEACDGQDNDCDGLVDGADGDIADGDGDGINACDDCDDGDPFDYPGNLETCDGQDNDCDGLIDGDDPDTPDDDGDGTGACDDCDDDDPALNEADGDGDGVTSCDGDCDDADPANHPGNTEVCDGQDNDCDGLVDGDDGDVVPDVPWYLDADGDGFGDPSQVEYACDAPPGYVADATDCDDGDVDSYPGAPEQWYDGIDQDCAGDGDYDQDGDGDDAEAYGGTDCDDLDPAVWGNNGCPPPVTCTHPSPATLAASDPFGAVDLQFDEDCNAYVSSIISGADYVYVIDEPGNVSIIYGYSDYNTPAIALDPVTGLVAASYNNNSSQAIGYQNPTTIDPVVYGTYTSGSLWDDWFMNQCTSSIVMDAAGCIWTPNFDGDGTLVCVETDGTTSLLTTLPYRVEGVDLDTEGQLYASAADVIYEVDKQTGTATAVYTATADVLDFVIDSNGDMYVETVDGSITLVANDGSVSTFATVDGQGKLAISPDRYLVRMMPHALSWSTTYEEWAI